VLYIALCEVVLFTLAEGSTYYQAADMVQWKLNDQQQNTKQDLLYYRHIMRTRGDRLDKDDMECLWKMLKRSSS